MSVGRSVFVFVRNVCRVSFLYLAIALFVSSSVSSLLFRHCAC